MQESSIAAEPNPLQPTPEHPFFVRHAGGGHADWVRASGLQVGDLVLTAAGAWTEVLAISPLEKEQVVYNFEVEENHDYFVGAAGVLVHNGGCGNSVSNRLQAIVDQAVERFEQEGFTPSQADAIVDKPNLTSAFIGERIDFYVREIVDEIGLPRGIDMTPRGTFGPDFFNSTTGDWWDVTTPGQWLSHFTKYGAGGTILVY